MQLGSSSPNRIVGTCRACLINIATRRYQPHTPTPPQKNSGFACTLAFAKKYDCFAVYKRQKTLFVKKDHTKITRETEKESKRNVFTLAISVIIRIHELVNFILAANLYMPSQGYCAVHKVWIKTTPRLRKSL